MTGVAVASVLSSKPCRIFRGPKLKRYIQKWNGNDYLNEAINPFYEWVAVCCIFQEKETAPIKHVIYQMRRPCNHGTVPLSEPGFVWRGLTRQLHDTLSPAHLKLVVLAGPAAAWLTSLAPCDCAVIC